MGIVVLLEKQKITKWQITMQAGCLWALGAYRDKLYEEF